MNLLKKHVVAFGLLAAIGLAPLAAQADSGSGSGGSPSAAASLNLRVTIPEFMYFRVGSTGTTVDTITFTPAAATIGDGAATAAGDSTASIRLRSNGGQVTIAQSDDNASDDGLVSGTNRISLSKITTNTDDGALPAPVLTDDGSLTSAPTLNGGAVTNRSAVWSYVYTEDATVPEAGDYDIEITYTATTL